MTRPGLVLLLVSLAVTPAISFSELVVLGQDSRGHLLVWGDRIYRSKNPLTAEDEHTQVLKGPGCDTRHRSQE